MNYTHTKFAGEEIVDILHYITALIPSVSFSLVFPILSSMDFRFQSGGLVVVPCVRFAPEAQALISFVLRGCTIPVSSLTFLAALSKRLTVRSYRKEAGELYQRSA